MLTGIVVIWLVIGLLLAAGAIFLVQWLRRQDMKVTWYEWLTGIIGLAVLLFAIQNFYGGFMENEAQSSWMFLLFPGLLALILIVIPVQLVLRRKRAA